MDEDRRIRFLVAPLLFLTSLGWGMWLDASWHDKLVALIALGGGEKQLGSVLTFLAGGGVVIFSLGVVIGTITYAILRTIFLISGLRSHEVKLSEEHLATIWKKLGIHSVLDPSKDLFAVVSFDHGILYDKHEGVHRWIVRRWNAFSINVTSVTALFLSLIIGVIIPIKFTLWWTLPIAISIFCFCAAAFWAWHDTMGMLAFQAALPSPVDERQSEQQ